MYKCILYNLLSAQINVVIIPEAFMTGIESTVFCVGYGGGLVQKIEIAIVSPWCSSTVKLSQLYIHKLSQKSVGCLTQH